MKTKNTVAADVRRLTSNQVGTCALRRPPVSENGSALPSIPSVGGNRRWNIFLRSTGKIKHIPKQPPIQCGQNQMCQNHFHNGRVPHPLSSVKPRPANLSVNSVTTTRPCLTLCVASGWRLYLLVDQNRWHLLARGSVKSSHDLPPKEQEMPQYNDWPKSVIHNHRIAALLSLVNTFLLSVNSVSPWLILWYR